LPQIPFQRAKEFFYYKIMEENKMQITKLTNRNTMFTTAENAEGDVHMGVIMGKKHNFIIDTGIGGDCAKAMLDFIGNDDKPIVVINTHHDWDHVWGNWVFENCEIVAHRLCHELMDKNFEADMTRAKANGAYNLGEVKKCLPNRLFDDVLGFPEDGITIVHTPGHTPDCICIYDTVDKVLWVGDTCSFDEDGAIYEGDEDDYDGFKHLVDTVKQFDVELCVTGHWPPQKDPIPLLEAELADWD